MRNQFNLGLGIAFFNGIGIEFWHQKFYPQIKLPFFSSEIYFLVSYIIIGMNMIKYVSQNVLINLLN